MNHTSVSDSVSLWIQNLKAGDGDASHQLWNRYFTQLVALAKARMRNQPRRAADEEDVALSVFKSLCRGAENGKFSELSERDDLWALLLTITKRKVINHVRRETAQKRGGGAVRGESIFWSPDATWGIDQIIGDEPSPAIVTGLGEEHERLMELLGDDKLRLIAVLRMEGHSNEEIAEKLNVTSRTIRRKLDLIREKWVKELDS